MFRVSRFDMFLQTVPCVEPLVAKCAQVTTSPYLMGSLEMEPCPRFCQEDLRTAIAGFVLKMIINLVQHAGNTTRERFLTAG